MTRYRALLVSGLVALLLLSGGAWWFWAPAADPKLVKAEQLSQQIFTPDGPPDLSRPETRAKMQELRQQVESMPEATRTQFMEQQRGQMTRMMEQHLDRFMAMSPDERTAELDRMIDRMEQFRQRRAEGRGPGGSESSGPTSESPAGGERPPGAPPEAPGGPPPFGGPPLGGPPPFGGGRGFPRDPQAMNERRRQMLDATSPELRAKMDVFRQALDSRMKQRGIAPPRLPF